PGHDHRVATSAVLHFSFLPLNHPPTTTLFPYTTLFRSWDGKLNGNTYPTHGLGPVANCLDINRGDRFDYLVSMSGPSRLMSRQLDRKSTRLNSSHVEISYAVFCLKKKTKRKSRSRSP